MFFCGSFSSEIKREIKRKAKHLSELSGENTRPLSCAHLKHQGGRPPSKYFERTSNGRLVTDIEHLAHHELFRGISRLIGLSEKQNEKSIKALREDVNEYNNENNVNYKIYEKKYREAQDRWIELYDSNPNILGLSTKKKNEIVDYLISSKEQKNNEETDLF